MIRIVKLGGNVVSVKNSSVPKLKRTLVFQIAECLRKWISSDHQLIIVLGTGSFGHPMARKYKIGLAGTDGDGALETRNSVLELLRAVTEIFIAAGIPVFPVSPSNIFLNGKIDGRIPASVLKNGFVPLLHGDVVLGRRGLEIYSGDKVVMDLALFFNADEVHFATDGDGVFDEKGRTIPVVERIDLKKITVQKKVFKNSDASSGFYGKLVQCARYMPKKGIRIYEGTEISCFKTGFVKNNGGTLII